MKVHVESEYRDGDEGAIVIMVCGVVGFIANDASTTPPDLDFVDAAWAHKATCSGCLGASLVEHCQLAMVL